MLLAGLILQVVPFCIKSKIRAKLFHCFKPEFVLSLHASFLWILTWDSVSLIISFDGISKPSIILYSILRSIFSYSRNLQRSGGHQCYTSTIVPLMILCPRGTFSKCIVSFDAYSIFTEWFFKLSTLRLSVLLFLLLTGIAMP